jgi:hypothetical protein
MSRQASLRIGVARPQRWGLSTGSDGSSLGAAGATRRPHRPAPALLELRGKEAGTVSVGYLLETCADCLQGFGLVPDGGVDDQGTSQVHNS